MTPTNSPIVTAARRFVEDLLQREIPDHYVYHTLDHTRETVENVLLIGKGEDLRKEEMEITLLAAWFHDTGFGKTYDRHEEESARVAGRFLTDEGYEPEKIARVIECIHATKMPQNPQSREARVLCDADLAHLGKKGFFKWSDRLKEEMARVLGEESTASDWNKRNVAFLVQHRYHTATARELFEKRKRKNRAKLKKLIGNDDEAPPAIEAEPVVSEKLIKQRLKEKIPERGIETMFRVTSRNHMELSSMADSKANLMISVNAIIISVVVSIFLRSFDEYPQFIIPTLVLIVVCVCTIIFATLSTRPKITSGRFTKEDIKSKRANLLFFGNFHRMELEDFQWGMDEMMNDRNYLYGSMIKDIYYLGKVLGVKYRYLRISYNVFMYGLIIAVLSYLAAILVYR